MEKGGWVYILTNKYNNVLCTGVTANLRNKVHEHKTKHDITSFTAKYNVDKLVYFEFLDTIVEAIEMEKKIKGGSRAKKIQLIETMNSQWLELFQKIWKYDKIASILSTKFSQGRTEYKKIVNKSLLFSLPFQYEFQLSNINRHH